ncbi:MAG: diguanylate cyclase [Armatimonadetes bacterium]|nr:diguanylate cyclase [Armatimonadota bacterium]
MRILVAEQDPLALGAMQRCLHSCGHEPVAFADGKAALACLRGDDAPRIALLGWQLPGLTGPEVCRRLRADADAGYVYVILLTERGSKEQLVRGLQAGADDYLSKPFDPSELEARIQAGARIVELEARHIQAQSLLRLQATRDGLTGLWNRNSILGILDCEVVQRTDDGTDLCAIMCDIDHFKRVNDTLGHMAGDDVLRHVAARIASSLRSCDSVGRFGGEEFLCVLPGCGRDHGIAVAERMRRHVAACPIVLERSAIEVTLSCGLADLRGLGLQDPRALLAAADDALYRAKSDGRDRVVAAVPAWMELRRTG